ncbi:MAG TPA: tRNA (adenosine(37)-N6)-threonylcarbamoyltransferase complex ATPase subunit type 1 TsaE [Candidatus Paceibacterota bacterium]
MDEVYSDTEVYDIAGKVLSVLAPSQDQATFLCLQGDLGAGKTTLTQAVAKHLGIEEAVVSPTFVIAKFYHPTTGGFMQLVHIDAYRIESDDELGSIGFDQLLKEPNTLVVVEWPERIKKSIPDGATWMNITHRDTMRHITENQ